MRVADVLREINHFLAQQKKFSVVVESGDSLFGGIDLKVGGDGLYMAQGFYASMGFAVPGAIGAQIGTGLRPLILTGDGGFQMTGVEIAHAPRHKLNPIVVLLNNGGWGIFRPIAKRQDLLTLPPWRYAELARLWGGRGFQAHTVQQLRRALDEAAKSSAFAIIEVFDRFPGPFSGYHQIHSRLCQEGADQKSGLKFGLISSPRSLLKSSPPQ